MARYIVRRRDLRPDGSVELVGSWNPFPELFPSHVMAGGIRVAPWMRYVFVAFVALYVVELAAEGRHLQAALLGFFDLFLLVVPRRVVTFDRATRMVGIRMRGLFGERGRQDIPFDQIRAVKLDVTGDIFGHSLQQLSLVLADERSLPLAEIFGGYDNSTLAAELDAVRRP